MQQHLTPDGRRYLTMTERPVPRPFHLRWLLPKLLGSHLDRWVWVSRASVLALAPLAWWFTGSPWMMCAPLLPGVWFNWRHPVLVDGVGMALALLAACLWPVSPPAAVVVIVIAGCVRETAPVWACLYAWTPELAIGLVPVVVRWGMRTGPDPCGYDQALQHPIRSAKEAHRKLRGGLDLLTPWGGMVASLGAIDVRLVACLAAGYGQLLIATDTVRLYQWAWPVVALACVNAAPQWLPLVAVLVVLNPWKGDGS